MGENWNTKCNGGNLEVKKKGREGEYWNAKCNGGNLEVKKKGIDGQELEH